MSQLQKLPEKRRKSMPSSKQVVEEALSKLGQNLSNQRFVRSNFDRLLRKLFEKTLHVLEEHEQRVDIQILQEIFNPQKGRGRLQIKPDLYRLLRDYFLSVSQSRKQRGGKDFELQVQTLLEKAGVPFVCQPKKERVDLILPNDELWKRDRARAVLISIKRTLRERWRQVVDELEQLRCPNTYLWTADERLAKSTVKEIFQRKIYLVVWDQVKKEFGNYRVFSITEFIKRLEEIHIPNFFREKTPDDS